MARLEVFFRLIKTTRTLEVWARNQGDAAFQRLRDYPLVESELSQRTGSLHLVFWRTLMPGYAYFEAHHTPLISDEH